MPAIFGIDISSNSLTIDWATTVSVLNPRFVYVRAYHAGVPPDSSYADPNFQTYWNELEALHLPRGAYIRCNPHLNPQDMLDAFFSTYKPEPGDLLPSIDIEDEWDNDSELSAQQRVVSIAQLLQGVAARIDGQMPLLYTKQRVWNDLANPTQFAAYPLWVQDYVNAPPASPVLPVAWRKYAFWQYEQNKQAGGIADYDSDLFNGLEIDLKNYTIQKVSA
jgi:lysozyme